MTAEPLDPALLVAPDTTQRLRPVLRLVPPTTPDVLAAGIPAHAHHFVQAAVEIVEGDRSPTQLLAWAAPRVYEDLVRRTRLRAHRRRSAPAEPRPRTRVVSVRVCQPRADVAEVAARVEHGARSYALAVRLEANGCRWICTALEWV